MGAVLLVICAVTAAGCGREEPADLANGKTLFIGEGTCGACHALERAGTSGTQGPDLDAAFGPSRQAGMNAETIEGIVLRQIKHPLRNSAMPANLVTGDDARDVAAYVAQAAGMPGSASSACPTARCRSLRTRAAPWRSCRATRTTRAASYRPPPRPASSC